MRTVEVKFGDKLDIRPISELVGIIREEERKESVTRSKGGVCFTHSINSKR